MIRPVGFVFAMVLALGACGGGGGKAGGNGGLGAEENAWFECKADADCVIVEMGCCDHCNGGWVMSARTDSTGPVRSRWGETCGPTIACTERACLEQPQPVCDRGSCARREQRVDSSGGTSEAIVPNQPH